MRDLPQGLRSSSEAEGGETMYSLTTSGYSGERHLIQMQTFNKIFILKFHSYA